MHNNESGILHNPQSSDMRTLYGELASRVMRHDNFMREVAIIDSNSQQVKLYAVTLLKPRSYDPEMIAVESEIHKTGLLGQAFRDRGYQVRRNQIDCTGVDVPEWLADMFGVPARMRCPARISEFYAKRAYNDPLLYGTVMEICVPELCDRGYFASTPADNHPPSSVLIQAGYTPREIYALLSPGPGFDSADPRYADAVEFLLLVPDTTRDKFLQYINSRISD